MHNEVNIPSKKWKCSILHKRCPFFSAEQTVRRWTPLGGLVLPAKIVAKFSVKQMLSRDTFDSTTKKVSLIATYVRENFTQSSCLSTTLDCSTQMQTVRFVIKLSWKVHLMLTKKTHQENAFKCESCDKVYNRKNNLENHRKTCGRLVRVLRKEDL